MQLLIGHVICLSPEANSFTYVKKSDILIIRPYCGSIRETKERRYEVSILCRGEYKSN